MPIKNSHHVKKFKSSIFHLLKGLHSIRPHHLVGAKHHSVQIASCFDIYKKFLDITLCIGFYPKHNCNIRFLINYIITTLCVYNCLRSTLSKSSIKKNEWRLYSSMFAYFLNSTTSHSTGVKMKSLAFAPSFARNISIPTNMVNPFDFK